MWRACGLETTTRSGFNSRSCADLGTVSLTQILTSIVISRVMRPLSSCLERVFVITRSSVHSAVSAQQNRGARTKADEGSLFLVHIPAGKGPGNTFGYSTNKKRGHARAAFELGVMSEIWCIVSIWFKSHMCVCESVCPNQLSIKRY